MLDGMYILIERLLVTMFHREALKRVNYLGNTAICGDCIHPRCMEM